MKQANISFNKGIHRTPSIGDSGELSELLHLIPQNGELVSIPPPTRLKGDTFLPTRAKLIAVHNVVVNGNKVKNFVYLQAVGAGDTHSYRIGFRSDVTDSTATQLSYTFHTDVATAAEAMGNVLYVYAGRREILWWDGSTYKSVTYVPEANLGFGLMGRLANRIEGSIVLDYGYTPGKIKEDDVEAVTQAVLGCADNVASDAKHDGYFVHNFFVRTGVELFDGSIVNLGPPVFMCVDNGPGVRMGATWNASRKELFYYTHAIRARLGWRRLDSSVFDNWTDIIRSINIYVSEPIPKYKQSGKIEEIKSQGTDRVFTGKMLNDQYSVFEKDTYTPTQMFGYYDQIQLPEYTEDEYTDRVEECSNFYLLKRIPVEDYLKVSPYGEFSEIVPETGYLDALTSRERLPDELKGRDEVIGEYAKTYNNRLNLVGAKLDLFAGYPADACVQYTENRGDQDEHEAYVFIKQNGQEFVLRVQDRGSLSTRFPFRYYFHPNPNAYKIVIVSDRNYKTEIDLKPHPFLHGAFGYKENGDYDWVASATDPQQTKSWTDYVHDRVYSSMPSNPWAIQSVNTLPVSEIYCLETTAKALSQGQFGQFPLYAFCDNGIWALEASNTGAISSRQPVTRDVLSVKTSVTQLDNAIAFVTKEGLKILSGSDTELISGCINGYNIDEEFAKDFIDETIGTGATKLLKDSESFNVQLQNEGTQLLYDYVNQFIHVFLAGKPIHYVYSRRAREWAKEPNVFTGWFKIIPCYPLPIIQFEATEGKSELGHYDVSSDTYSTPTGRAASGGPGIIITKSYSFNDPFVRKALYDLRVFGQMLTDASQDVKIDNVTYTYRYATVGVYVSGDNHNWKLLRSLKAMSARFYRFVIITRLAGAETISGMSLHYEERFGHKFR